MPGKLPYFPFYPDDWLSDEKLRLCSLAARGLWIDLLALMHKCDRRGYLQQATGKPMTAEQLARLTGCDPGTASRLLQELITSGVASVSSSGVVYNRRMASETLKRQLCSKAGRKGGGNPRLNGHSRDSPGVSENPTFKGQSKGQSKGPYGSDSGSGSDLWKGGGPGEEGLDGASLDGFSRFWAVYPLKVDPLEAQAAWQEIAPGPELMAKMLAALEWQPRQPEWQRDGGQYIPHPAKWLRKQRWLDEKPKGLAKTRPTETEAQKAARIAAERAEADRARDAAKHTVKIGDLVKGIGGMP